MMKQILHAESLEELLLSYAEMCYSVAFALTRNPDRAQDLARHVLTWAWRLPDTENSQKGMKKLLLTELRERFLQDCSRTVHNLGNHAALAERT